jgi:hypothetical protein
MLQNFFLSGYVVFRGKHYILALDKHLPVMVGHTIRQQSNQLCPTATGVSSGILGNFGTNNAAYFNVELMTKKKVL